MDIKAYIESGILESYVMGLATEAECREVEFHAAKFPEIKNELLAIELSINKYALLHQKNPPEHLKEKIFSQISSQENKTAKIIDIKTAKAPDNTAGKNSWSFWVAASVLLLLVSVAGNYFLYNKWRSAENELIALNAEKTMIADQLNIQKTSFEKMNAEMAVLKQPFNKVVSLKGIPAISPNSLATVYWNQNSKEVFINVNSLPVPPADKQYQLWALANGTPIDAGVFEASDSVGLQKMKVIENAQAFAVTLEQKGGSQTPTLAAMYVMGAM